jgi:hypothetical protein
VWRRLAGAERAIIGAVVIGAIVVRLYLITHFNINWDEFYYLSHVYDHLRGELWLKLQTFHVHLFGWLTAVPGNEVDQIIVGRAVMLGLHLLTTWLLYRIARRLTSPNAALFAVAAYLSFSFVLWTGASFRSDPILTCLVMAALDLILTRREGIWQAAMAGVLLAFAAMITIKAAIFLPSFAIILAGRLGNRSRTVGVARSAAVMAVVGMTSFALLYGLHSVGVDEAIAQSSTEVAAGSLSKTVMEAGLFPRLAVLLVSLKWDVVYWALWVAGGVLLAKGFWNSTGSDRLRWLEIAALALPVASLAVYRNSFSYFYPSILAPASILTALTWEALTERAAPQGNGVVLVVVKLFALTWFFASLIFHGLYVPNIMPLEQQRTVLAAVHRAFPSSTPYLDSSSMVASFPQVGFFMSTWGMDVYLQRGEPVLQRAIEKRQPPLLLANHALLDPENAAYPASLAYRPELLPADREAVAAAYIHHWGPIYVAGKRFEAPGSAEPARFDLAIAGRYTLEAPGPIRIDGHVVQPGRPVDLTRGPHWVTAVGATGQVTLRWGEGLYRPAEPPPETRLYFLGF